MPTRPGDPEGPPARPGGGWWGSVWRRLSQAASTEAAAPADPSAGNKGPYSREALQAMIERKRRNDLLRRHEFGMLRKVLRQEAAAAPAPLSVPAPQTFHSSIPATPDERATTLRKINEIEAQMSGQWRPVKARQTARRPAVARLSRDPLTGPQVPPAPASMLLRTAVTLARMPWAPHTKPELPQSSCAQDGVDFIHDPEFEEAALRFASGDTAGAEAALRAMLEPAHPRAAQAETWLYLFDLHRAAGQPDRYDDLVAEFARRLQRSAPPWRDLQACPPRDTDTGEAPRVFPASALGEPAFDWTCPPLLDAAGVAGLQQALAGRPQPWRLSWVPLTRLEPDAVAPLAIMVAHWARRPVRLRLAGTQALERILDARTACGDRSVDPAWWALRLDWLRATRRPAEFELVALDYCVTYEVSPPSWDPPVCDLRLIGADGPGEPRQPVAALEPRVSVLGEGGSTTFAASTQAASWAGELAGTLQGDAVVQALSRLQARLDARQPAADLLEISCERLLRLDFEAAGALANWVSARRREGCSVHLAHAHRLVAALLAAVGLSTQARITLRRD